MERSCLLKKPARGLAGRVEWEWKDNNLLLKLEPYHVLSYGHGQYRHMYYIYIYLYTYMYSSMCIFGTKVKAFDVGGADAWPVWHGQRAGPGPEHAMACISQLPGSGGRRGGGKRGSGARWAGCGAGVLML